MRPSRFVARCSAACLGSPTVKSRLPINHARHVASFTWNCMTFLPDRAQSTIGALAHLQIGRAYAIQGDAAKAKAAYQDFLTLWKNADRYPFCTRVPEVRQSEFILAGQKRVRNQTRCCFVVLVRIADAALCRTAMTEAFPAK
jgi:hypothetical protein